jgi:RNA polymerase sigma-70 factor, ECF subfamily
MDSSRSSQVPMMQECLLDTAPTETPSGGLAFDTVFEQQLAYVWNSLRRLGVPPRDVEDLAHDVFLKVYGQFNRYEPGRPIRPWLFGFAARVASDYRRRARNRLEVLDSPAEPCDPEPSALEQLLSAEAMSTAEKLLEHIELGPRAVFILHELDECTIPEVARALGIPIPTAYSRLRLARKQFSLALERLGRRGGER